MTDHTCLVCKHTSEQTPLIAFEFQGKTYFVCPQHLPLLIHKPHELVGLLPGADKLSPYQD